MKSAVIATSIALLPTIFSLAPAGQAPAPARGPSIAFVSTQRILADATEFSADVARFQAAQVQKAREVRAKQQALESTRLQLTAGSDDATREKLLQEEAQRRSDFERASAQAQTDLQTMQRQMNADLQTRVKAVLEELVKGQNIQVVLNAETAVVWAAPGADLTAAVVARLNAKPAAK